MIFQRGYLTPDQAQFQRWSARRGVGIAESDEHELGHDTPASSPVTWGLVFIVMICVTGFTGFAIARLYDDPTDFGAATLLQGDGDEFVRMHEEALRMIHSCHRIGRLK